MRHLAWIGCLALGGVLALPVDSRACGESKSKQQNASKQAPAGSKRLVLAVSGMSCGGCAQRISAALSKVDGVFSAKVDVKAKRAHVTYAPKKVAATKLVAAVNKLGYKASVVSGREKG